MRGGLLNGYDRDRDGEYPGSLGVGPDAAAAGRERASAPHPHVYVSELARMLGIQERDVMPLYISALAHLGFPKPMLRIELQRFPTPAVETHYWERFAVTQWLDRFRAVKELEAALQHTRRVADAERRRADLLEHAARNAYRMALTGATYIGVRK